MPWNRTGQRGHGSAPRTSVQFRSGWLWKLLNHRRGWDDLDLRERKEISTTYANTSARAQGRNPDHSGESVTTSEQFAGLRLLADLANRHARLRSAVVAQMDDQLRETLRGVAEGSGPPDSPRKDCPGMSEENGSHSVEFMSNMWVASAAHEWMVVTLEQAKDSVKKVPTRAPAQETTAYLGDLGPYSC